jgi:DNA-binding FadR family transcriptional regulator
MADWTGRPAYAQVADELRIAIRDGRFAPGSQLPSYEALMKQYGVSITVIRSAVRELKTEGLVITHQGKGAFVRDPLPPAAGLPGGAGSEAFQAVMIQIRSLHDGLSKLDERLGRVERQVFPEDTSTAS